MATYFLSCSLSWKGHNRLVHPDLPFTSLTYSFGANISHRLVVGDSVLLQADFTRPQSAVQLQKMKMHTTCIVMTLQRDFLILTKLKRTNPGNHEYCPYQTDKKIMCQSLQGKCLVNMLSISCSPQTHDGIRVR